MPLRRMRPLVLLVAVAIGVTVFAVVNPVSGTPAGTRNGELVADGAWCWFQDPRAVHYVGAHDRTYIGYVTSTGDVDVVSEDAGSATLAHTTLHAGFQRDDHAAPGLEVLPSGQIAVFYAKHTGSAMYYRISTRPEDITSFGPEHTVGVNTAGAAGYTYANPIYLSAEKRTYLFFRAANSKPAVTWSDDNLKTWAPAQPLLSGSAVRPYVKYATNGTDKIFITFDDGHPRDVAHNSVYALTYSNGQLTTMDGTAVATMGQPAGLFSVPPAPVNIASVPPFYDGSGPDGKAWVQDAALDSKGNPVVLFASFPNGDSDHHYHYARWDGKQWQQTDFTTAGGSIDAGGQEPDYSGGMSLDPNDVSTVYTSREINGQWEIQQWHTGDGGKTFDSPVAITQNSTQKNARPVIPWGPAGPVKVLWMSGTYTNWKAGYKTQLRELTSDPAPTTSRISVPTAGVVTGTATTISGRVVQGYQGAPKAGVRVELWGHSAGRPYSWQATATSDSAGLVHFRITAARTAAYEIRASAGSGFGASTSPETTVTTVTGTRTRVSVDHTTVHSGTAVHVGLRVVNAGTGHGIAGAHVQLWQRVSGGTWTRRTSVAVDSGGLAHVTTRPSQRVSYQARYPGNSSYAASSSPEVTVAVTR
jgi:protocatechuate 3,4-dioxygenase beta subunit